MMALIPMAVLAAWPLRLVPRRWAWPMSIVLATVIAVAGLREWHDPAFWVFWSQRSSYHF
jgi:hypothetical protein